MLWFGVVWCVVLSLNVSCLIINLTSIFHLGAAFMYHALFFLEFERGRGGGRSDVTSEKKKEANMAVRGYIVRIWSGVAVWLVWAGVMEVYRVANRLIASSKTYGSCWWRCYQHATATHTLSMLSELARETQQTWDLFRSKVAHLGHRFFVMPDDVGGHIDSALEAPPPLSSPPTPITVDPSRCTLCLLPIRHPFHHPFPHPSHTNHPDLELHSHEAGAGACELIWRDKRFHASCANFWVNRVTINPPFR